MPAYRMKSAVWMTNNGISRVYGVNEIVELTAQQALYLQIAGIVEPAADAPAWTIAGGANEDAFVIDEYTGKLASAEPIDLGEYEVLLAKENAEEGSPSLLRVTITVEDAEV
jgi:hypothetical protein